MMLETVAAVPGMVYDMLLHCKSLRRFEHSGGWIKALLEEAKNERMHLRHSLKSPIPGGTSEPLSSPFKASSSMPTS